MSFLVPLYNCRPMLYDIGTDGANATRRATAAMRIFFIGIGFMLILTKIVIFPERPPPARLFSA